MINIYLMTALSTLTAVVLAAAIKQRTARAITEEELSNLLDKLDRAYGEETAEERDAQQASLAQILAEQPANTTTPDTSSDRRPQHNRDRPPQAQALHLRLLVQRMVRTDAALLLLITTTILWPSTITVVLVATIAAAAVWIDLRPESTIKNTTTRTRKRKKPQL